MLIYDVIPKCNLFESLCSCDDDFPGTENTGGNLLHILCRLEFYLYSRIPVGFERNTEYIGIFLKMIRGFHKVYIIVDTEVRVDHDNAKRIKWRDNIVIERLQYIHKTFNDMFTVK